MKKLLTLFLLLVSSTPAFGAATHLKHIATIARAAVTSPIAFSRSVAHYYRNKDVFTHQALKMRVQRDWTIKRIATLEKETGMTAQQAGKGFQPVPTLLGGDMMSDPLFYLRLKPLESLSKIEQLAVLNSTLPSLPEVPQGEKIIAQHSPLLVTGLLAQIPGTDEYKAEQVYPHTQQLIDQHGSDTLKALLYPVKK